MTFRKIKKHTYATIATKMKYKLLSNKSTKLLHAVSLCVSTHFVVEPGQHFVVVEALSGIGVFPPHTNEDAKADSTESKSAKIVRKSCFTNMIFYKIYSIIIAYFDY